MSTSRPIVIKELFPYGIAGLIAQYDDKPAVERAWCMLLDAPSGGWAINGVLTKTERSICRSINIIVIPCNVWPGQWWVPNDDAIAVRIIYEVMHMHESWRLNGVGISISDFLWLVSKEAELGLLQYCKYAAKIVNEDPRDYIAGLIARY